MITIYNLRVHRAEHHAEASAAAWSMRTALVVLGVATVATAFVAEIVVGSLEEFGDKVGLSEFFVSIVIVAIVGNAAEHGGAIVVATRGKIKLATEIAVSRRRRSPCSWRPQRRCSRRWWAPGCRSPSGPWSWSPWPVPR